MPDKEYIIKETKEKIKYLKKLFKEAEDMGNYIMMYLCVEKIFALQDKLEYLEERVVKTEEEPNEL